MSASEYIALGSVLVTLSIGLMTLAPALRRVLQDERAYRAARLDKCQEDLESYRRKYMDTVLAGKRLISEIDLLLMDHQAKCKNVPGCPFSGDVNAKMAEILTTYRGFFANGDKANGDKTD